MDREMVLMVGTHGSGTSRLCRTLVETIQPRQSVEHISTGDRIRAIGRGVLWSAETKHIQDHLNSPVYALPLNDEVIHTVVEEALAQHEDKELILLDGYPRRQSQVPGALALAHDTHRPVIGMIVTHTAPDVAVMRLMQRERRFDGESVSIMAAKDRVAYSTSMITPMISSSMLRFIPTEYIDTTQPKRSTTELGLLALARFSSPS